MMDPLHLELVATFVWHGQHPTKKIPVVMVSKIITVPSRNSYRQTLLKPQAVDLYNHNMNGVDVADQLTVFYPFIRKISKWWRKLFFWLVEVAVINSYILYKKEAVHPLTSHGTCY